jgi:hypothetical protein
LFRPRAPDQREDGSAAKTRTKLISTGISASGVFGRRAQDHGVKVTHHRLQRQQQADQREAERGRHHQRLGRVHVADHRQKQGPTTARPPSRIGYTIVSARAAKPGNSSAA